MLDKEKLKPFEEFSKRLPPVFEDRWREAAEKDYEKSKNLKKYKKKLEEMVYIFSLELPAVADNFTRSPAEK